MNIQRPKSNQPIPPHAKRVFKGVMFDVYQWEQELFNGKKEIFEKIKRPDTVNVIPVTTDGKIVISKQKQPGTTPFLGGLGGRIDEGESPLQAAKRELLEEAGMEANEYVLWDAIQPSDKIEWAIYSFIAKGCKKIQEPHLDAGEDIELMDVSFDEFLKLTANEQYRDLEVSLKVFRMINDPKKLEETRKLFLEK